MSLFLLIPSRGSSSRNGFFAGLWEERGRVIVHTRRAAPKYFSFLNFLTLRSAQNLKRHEVQLQRKGNLFPC